MTALGKLFVFLLLFLSLVWSFLTLNAYATRTNWQASSKKYQEQAQLAAESANKMKALLDAEREAAEDAKRSLQQERDRYYSQVAELLQVREQLSAQYNLAFADAQKKQAEAAKLQAEIEKLTVQVTTLDDELKAKDLQVTKLATEANDARANRERTKLENDSLKVQLDAKNDEIRNLNDRVNELRNGVAGIPGARTPNAPANFRGTITQVQGDVVEFTPGADAGLKPGTILRVERTTPIGVFVGKLTVSLVEPKRAAGVFEPAVKNAPRNASNTPKAGDNVAPYNR